MISDSRAAAPILLSAEMMSLGYRVPKFWTHWKKYNTFCDLCVREKDWRVASQAFERMHNTLSHRSKT